jgi:excisionase family DNA binding protein
MIKHQRTWLTVAEAAEYFQISPKTLYSLAARDRLPEGAVLKLGRQLRLNVEAIEHEAGGKRK